MDMMEVMKARHSVRQYKDVAIDDEKRKVLDEMAKFANEEAGLNIQIIYDEPKCFDSFMAHYGKFSGVNSYIALIGKKSADLDEKLGYYGEKLALKAQELGLNTCWVAMSHGKSAAKINKGEKLGCIISLGYGENEGVTHKNKALAEVSNCDESSPEWFRKGVEAALLAPTAMNQQKFRFDLQPDGSVKTTCGKGFYAKMDLGIVKYHFEAVTGKKPQ